MGYKYHGPNFEELDLSIRSRIERAARVAEENTPALGVLISDETGRVSQGKLYSLPVKEFREIFVFRTSGNLREAYFNTGERVYSLDFCGAWGREDMLKVEEALEIKVTNINEGSATVGGQALEKIDSLKLWFGIK